MDFGRKGRELVVVNPHSKTGKARGLCRAGAVALFALTFPMPAAAQLSQPFWGSYGRDAQHSGLSAVASQPLTSLHWQTRVDRRPQYSGNNLLIHYGSPVITQANTLIVPVKVGRTDRFRLEGRRGSDGGRLWRQSSNYRLPPHDWTLSFSPVLSPTGKLWLPAGGGTLLYRTQLDLRGSQRATRVAFYGTANYLAHRSAYLHGVFINTPLTADAAGNVFFGFQVTGSTPIDLQSGIARITDAGLGSAVTAAAAAGDPSITKVAHNSAPALSNDGSMLYVAVNNGAGLWGAAGYLLALDSQTLATIAAVRLRDPVSGNDAIVHDDGTASPTVGPDGDVYFGVLENPFPSNNDRGWLLHFDAWLNPKGPPGAFGWDDTATVVPAAMVPSYAGASTYLLMTKYNNYAGIGSGDGVNRLAILDPNDQMTDPISGATVMREVLTVAGATPDAEFLPTFPGAVREWCINSAAVDPISKAIIANSEDGKLYRWDMTTNTLSQAFVLTSGVGEAYTPTLIGPDGTVYAINNANLFAVGQ
jgi:hypothetical protein